MPISPHTVHSHVKRVYEKLHATDKRDALAKARRKGLPCSRGTCRVAIPRKTPASGDVPAGRRLLLCGSGHGRPVSL